jgi:hypothetical protein
MSLPPLPICISALLDVVDAPPPPPTALAGASLPGSG